MAQVVSFALKAGALYMYSVGFVGAGQFLYAASVAVDVGNAEEQKRRQRRRAIAEYNAGLQDRLEMVDITPDAPRTLALGRVRSVEGVRRRWVSGANGEKLTMVVSFAGHEIDGFEQWYLDDNLVTLDAQGWVQEAPYSTAEAVQASAVGTLDGAGNATIMLADVPASGGVVFAVWSTGSGDNLVQGAAAVTVSGLAASVTGGPPDASVTVGYTRTVVTSHVRIRPWLGTAGQNVGAALAAEYPGKITATDRFAGMALAVVDVLYSPDIFPQGRPNVTAVFRGARCFDPRTGTTAWTENPAVHAYHYARWANGWAVPAEEINTADVVAAANVCDVSTVFTVRKPGEAATTVTLPRYRSGIVISSAADPREAMNEIMEAMAGRHGWAGGEWRFRAGVVAASVFNLVPNWLARPVSAEGEAEDSPVVRITNGVPREQRVNRVSGKCVDPAQRWQVLPFPAVQDSALIATNGEAPLEVEFQAVNHIAHAQHLASVAIRQSQAPLRLDMQCNLHAWRCELFDVGTVNLPRFGFTNKAVEVVGWRWHPTQGVSLRLAEIAPAMFEPVAELVGRDPAPDSTLRRPWDVETLGALTVTSGTQALTDGSIIARANVAWPPATGQSVRVGGQIEVQYSPAGAPTATINWATWPEPGNATNATIPGLLAGRYYLFRARAVQLLPLVRGAWSPVVLHKVADARQITLQSLGYTGAPNATAGSVLNNDPGCTTPSLWAVVGTGFSVQAVTDGIAGPSVWRKGQAGGLSYTISNQVPVDKAKTYRAKWWIRKSSGANGGALPAVAMYTGAGASIEWAGDYPFGNVPPGFDWFEYVATFGAGTARPIPANAVTVAIGAFLGYGTTTGYHEMQGVRLEEVTDLVATAAAAAADATAKANAAQAAAVAAADVAAQAKADLAETTAKAYADGVVSAEEARAIADATAKANAAQAAAVAAAAADATAKANAAALTAEWSGVSGVNVTTTQIAAGAATAVSVDNFDFAGATYGTATARTVTVTPPVDCTVEFTASIVGSNVVGDAGNQLGWTVTPAGGAEVSLGGAGVSTASKQQITSATAFAAAGGVALTFAIKTTRPGGNPNIGLFQSQMRITQIKR